MSGKEPGRPVPEDATDATDETDETDEHIAEDGPVADPVPAPEEPETADERSASAGAEGAAVEEDGEAPEDDADEPTDEAATPDDATPDDADTNPRSVDGDVDEVDEDDEDDEDDAPAVHDSTGPTDATGATQTSELQEPKESDGAWHRLGAALRPRFSRSQLLAGLLCAALGFALVVQVQQSSSDQLSSARQDDLVRLLDEVTDRAEQLATEVAGLESTRDELESGSDKAQSALELAQERAESEGILSGRLPAEGPGVQIVVTDPDGVLEAAQMFNVLEELRNAGAEVVQVDDVRLVTSTWFRDDGTDIVVDGQKLEAPYVWKVIGDPQTLDRALEIPGGALATVRNAGGDGTTTQQDKVKISAVREPSEPEYAQPQERQE